ncbi:MULTISPECIES: class D sortase [unclassified Sutcliffiella]|uniref:class D sortase n=1 Tax=unclassified Sutcliffiella TaxID=2837532 RepID=UPI0030D086C2
MLLHVIRICGIVLFVVGAALFVGSGLLYWKGISAVEERSDTVEEFSSSGLEDLRLGESRVAEEGEHGESVEVEAKVAVGEEIGEVYFPVLEVGMPVFHGVSEDELVKGVGHVPGSRFPGEGGNIVLSGHRDTVFRRLGELKVGDKVVLGFDGGEYIYKVARVRVVDKEDTSVVVPRAREVLTITTCYPFRFIGSAPERYVVEAEFLRRMEGESR